MSRGLYFALSQAGAQDPASLRMPNDGQYEHLLEWHEIIRIFTFAPELPGVMADYTTSRRTWHRGRGPEAPPVKRILFLTSRWGCGISSIFGVDNLPLYVKGRGANRACWR